MKRNKLGQFIKGSNGNVFEGFGVWYDVKGYPTIWIDGKSIKVHVYVWERVYGEKPEGFVVHHIDFNKKNFDLDNLELLSESNHKRVHAGWVREKGTWIAKPCNMCKTIYPLSNFYPRKGYTPTALCKRCHNIKVDERRRLKRSKGGAKCQVEN